MSFPKIPNVTSEINLNKEQITNLLIASIAFEELALSHIINAEAEKIQYILGTLDGVTPPSVATIAEVLQVNNSAETMMRSVIKNQMLLQYKLEDAIKYSEFEINLNVATVTAEYDNVTVTANDLAYYYTKGGAV